MSWSRILDNDLVSWLLEHDNAPVRYRTLVDLLGRSPDDLEVQGARSAVRSGPPVADLLAGQKRDGYWIKRDYYLPRHAGTFWTLSLLADMGLTAEDEPIRRACEFMFTFQQPNGAFWRRRRVSGRGWVWLETPGTCTHARVIRFLIQFGYSDDPRLRAGVNWLRETQREDGLWHCQPDTRRGCVRATLDVLRVAALDPLMAADPAISRGAEALADLLMEPRMSRYHVGERWGRWATLEFPLFGFSAIAGLQALGALGFQRDDARIAAAIDYLLARRLPDGRWPLDPTSYQAPFDVGPPGQANKWVTLEALLALRPFLASAA